MLFVFTPLSYLEPFELDAVFEQGSRLTAAGCHLSERADGFAAVIVRVRVSVCVCCTVSVNRKDDSYENGLIAVYCLSESKITTLLCVCVRVCVRVGGCVCVCFLTLHCSCNTNLLPPFCAALTIDADKMCRPELPKQI